MRNKRFFLILFLSMGSQLCGNPVMVRYFNELYIGPNGWVLELNPRFDTMLPDTCLLATQSDTARFITIIAKMKPNWETYTTVTPESLDRKIEIHGSGDTLSLLDLNYRNFDDFKFSSIPTGYSLNRLGSYLTYLDRTPTIGAVNDTSGAMGWIQGGVTDENGHPLINVRINWEYYFAATYCAFSDSLGRFRLRAIAGEVDFYFNRAGLKPCMKSIAAYPDSTIVADVMMEKESDAVDIESSDKKPLIFLSDNYPNPFNSFTKFQYTSPSDGFIDIAVFDIRGRRLETLLQGFQRKGEYRLSWDAFEAPSGIYFCRLQSGQSVLKRKWMLIR